MEISTSSMLLVDHYVVGGNLLEVGSQGHKASNFVDQLPKI
jgi:hypothetical protein